jgi:Holliday junction resolvasome RuvABC ATP-dependent DNA helicase subunit
MTLRPSLFSEFTGQPKIRERIEIAVSDQGGGVGMAD